MAKLDVSTKVEKETVTITRDKEVKTYNLELSLAELNTLSIILCQVGGDSKNSKRKFVDNMINAIAPHVKLRNTNTAYIDNSQNVHNSIYLATEFNLKED